MIVVCVVVFVVDDKGIVLLLETAIIAVIGGRHCPEIGECIAMVLSFLHSLHPSCLLGFDPLLAVFRF